MTPHTARGRDGARRPKPRNQDRGPDRAHEWNTTQSPTGPDPINAYINTPCFALVLMRPVKVYLLCDNLRCLRLSINMLHSPNRRSVTTSGPEPRDARCMSPLSRPSLFTLSCAAAEVGRRPSPLATFCACDLDWSTRDRLTIDFTIDFTITYESHSEQPLQRSHPQISSVFPL